MALNFQPLFGARDRNLRLRVDPYTRVVRADGGGAALLGCTAADLVGRSFGELVHGSDRPLAAQLLRIAEAGGQVNRQLVALAAADGGTEPFLVDARHARQGDDVILEMNSPPPEERDAMGYPLEALSIPFDDRDAFTLSVGDRVNGDGGDDDYGLTLVEVQALEDADLRDRIGDSRMDALRESTEGTLRILSSGGKPGRLGGHSYGLLHDRRMDSAEITEQVAQAAARSGVDAGELGLGAVTLDMTPGDLGAQDISMAVDHVVSAFVDQGAAAGTFASLTTAHQSAIEDAARRVVLLREALANEAVSLRFRPVFDLRSGSPTHHETRMLIAMEDHYVEPAPLVRLAGDPQLAAAVDQIAMRRAMTFLGAATTQRTAPIERLLLPFSALSMSVPGFTTAMTDAWQALPLVADRLGLLLADFDEASSTSHFASSLAAVRDNGHAVGIDSLAPALIPLPAIDSFGISLVRLAPRYSRAAIQPGDSGALMRELLGAWSRFGVDVIADGIAGPGMLNRVRETHISLGSGPHFGGWMAPPKGAVSEP